MATALGILASDWRPDLWPIWTIAALLTALLLLKFPSSLGVYGSTFVLFGFWHGYQIDTNEGFRQSTELKETERIVTLLVTSEPQINMLRLTHRFTALVKTIDNRPAGFLVAAECAGGPFAYGDEILAHGKFSHPNSPLNPGEFNYAEFLRHQNIYLEFRSSHGFPPEITAHDRGSPLIARALALRHWIAETLKTGLDDDPEVAETIQGMVLGARGETNSDLKKLFQETGTIHLFAASGLQVALFGGLAWSGIRYLRLQRRFAALAIIPMVVSYCAITGFHPATVRATVMAVLLAIGVSLERPSVAINTLAASGLIILTYNTQQLFQVGFQLSFAAVVGIIILVDRGTDLLFRPFQLDPFFPRRLLRSWQRIYFRFLFLFCESLSLTLVCWLATSPVLILWENHLSLVSIAANLVVVPLASVVMVLGVISMLVMPVYSGLAIYLNNTSWLITKVILFLLHGAVWLPSHSLNVAFPGALTTDSMTILSEGTSHVCHLRFADENWLLNIGTPPQWERITLPYLRFQGINQINGLIVSDIVRKQIGNPSTRHDEMPLAQVIEPTTNTGNPADNTVQNRNPIDLIPNGALRLFTVPDGKPILKNSQKADDLALFVRIGRFHVLILTDLTDLTLDQIPAQHVDIVYCAHTRTRRFPRETLAGKLSPQAIILTGTKPELAAATDPNGPKWIFIKQTGAVTASANGDELLVNGFRGLQLHFRSLSR